MVENDLYVRGKYYTRFWWSNDLKIIFNDHTIFFFWLWFVLFFVRFVHNNRVDRVRFPFLFHAVVGFTAPTNPTIFTWPPHVIFSSVKKFNKKMYTSVSFFFRSYARLDISNKRDFSLFLPQPTDSNEYVLNFAANIVSMFFSRAQAGRTYKISFPIFKILTRQYYDFRIPYIIILYMNIVLRYSEVFFPNILYPCTYIIRVRERNIIVYYIFVVRPPQTL